MFSLHPFLYRAAELNANTTVIYAIHRLLSCSDHRQFRDGNGVVRLPTAGPSRQRADDGWHALFRYGRREASALRVVPNRCQSISRPPQRRACADIAIARCLVPRSFVDAANLHTGVVGWNNSRTVRRPAVPANASHNSLITPPFVYRPACSCCRCSSSFAEVLCFHFFRLPSPL